MGYRRLPGAGMHHASGLPVLETSASESESGDWWQYCCPKHARHFADQHGLETPAAAPRASRSMAVQ